VLEAGQEEDLSLMHGREVTREMQTEKRILRRSQRHGEAEVAVEAEAEVEAEHKRKRRKQTAAWPKRIHLAKWM
jgi:hypothetical protein